MSGKLGWFSWPTALMTTLNLLVSLRPPASTVTSHWPVHVSNFAARTCVANLMCSRTPSFLLAWRKYSRISPSERVLVRPVVALQERVAVAEVAGVQAAAGVIVLEPDAADIIVTLEDHEVDAGLKQPVGHGQTGHARADDGHPEVPARGERGLGPAGASLSAGRPSSKASMGR